MADGDSTSDAQRAIVAVRKAIAAAAAEIRKVDDFDAALNLAELLRDKATADLIDVRFLLIVDEYVRHGHNATHLGEALGLTRQRASAMVKQARDRGIVVPPKK